MAKLDEQAKEAILTNLPALVATAGKDGKPNVSAKGSLRVLDEDHVTGRSLDFRAEYKIDVERAKTSTSRTNGSQDSQ